MSPFEVRPEEPGDQVAIARVNDAAFGQADESRIIGHPNLSLVAVDGSEVVGPILFTPVMLESRESGAGVMGLGPMAVSLRIWDVVEDR
jgi:predicted N-acetyltransferase YhbS